MVAFIATAVRTLNLTWNDKVKDDFMPKACSTDVKKRNACRILVGESE
jgi:hypothetical protein